jgi:hypothetical protein
MLQALASDTSNIIASRVAVLPRPQTILQYSTITCRNGTWRPGNELLQCSDCSAALEFLMREIVDQALGTYELIGKMDATQVAQSRARIAQYIDKLVAAGQADPDRLTEYARAYLKELHEGPDPRFTGCWSRRLVLRHRKCGHFVLKASNSRSTMMSSRDGTIEGAGSQIGSGKLLHQRVQARWEHMAVLASQDFAETVPDFIADRT